MIDRRHARDPVAEGVPGDDRGDVAGEIVEGETVHRSGARAGAARLRAQHANSGFRDPGGDLVVVLRIAAARRQEDDERSRAFRDHLDARVACGDDVARALGARRYDGYPAPGSRAMLLKRRSTRCCTAIAPPRSEYGVMPKSVWSNESRPVTLIFSASASISAGTCRVRMWPCSVIATAIVAFFCVAFAPATPMSANGNLSSSSTFSSMWARVPSMSDSVGCVSKPASARSAASSTARRASTTYRSARPSPGAT